MVPTERTQTLPANEGAWHARPPQDHHVPFHSVQTTVGPSRPSLKEPAFGTHKKPREFVPGLPCCRANVEVTVLSCWGSATVALPILAATHSGRSSMSARTPSPATLGESTMPRPAKPAPPPGIPTATERPA